MSNGILNLHETKMELNGARKVLMKLHDEGLLVLCGGGTKADNKVYTDALYDLILHDDAAMYDYLAGLDFRFYGHERDKNVKLVKCKARRMYNDNI